MKDGTIVSGTSVESYRSWSCWIERSTDGGKTWSKFGPITVPADAEVEAPPANRADLHRSHGIIQPSVVSLGGNRLRFYARSTSRIGKVCVADSSDGGVTWTQAHPIGLPNPSAGVDAVALGDGRVVLVYNHTVKGRTPLNLAVSSDGENFRMFHTLEDQPGEFSYPAMIQGKDGDLHITYTWNRKRVRYVRFALSTIPK
jgi:predicted neuraminidase